MGIGRNSSDDFYIIVKHQNIKYIDVTKHEYVFIRTEDQKKESVSLNEKERELLRELTYKLYYEQDSINSDVLDLMDPKRIKSKEFNL